jgi:cation:H+ antiporter
MEIFLIILGFILLLISGNWLVKSGVAMAKQFNIPTLIIGVTIISIGTSAPELVVSIQAAIGGFPDIATGNVIGSNIANIALVLGLTAIITLLPVKRETVLRDWPVMVGASLLFLVFSLDKTISRWEGIVLLVGLLGYIYITIRQTKNNSPQNKEAHADTDEEDEEPEFTIAASIVILILSVGGLVLGSRFLVIGAGELALKLGVSERIVSITVIAFGTSVPELATSLVAAFKKQPDISVGNLIGSNIFNILAIMGLTATIKPIRVNETILINDMPWMIGIALVLGLLLLPAKNSKLYRWKGVILISIYISYFFVILNGL